MTDPLPVPGPSFLREQELRIGQRRFVAGMSRPASTDAWWVAVLWLADGVALARFDDLTPGGPPPEPPAARLGMAMAGSLSGYILEDAGRLQIRLAPVIPPVDPERPWRAPAIVRAGFRWEPARAATVRPNDLATEVLTAFRRAAESLVRR
ncbi:MAG TPA: hypothetical protein VJ506_06255 [Candidatus Limnocylindrales bacterium]|nr:hypothetical protein [Candidatus Limnocylindrales bacterium]